MLLLLSHFSHVWLCDPMNIAYQAPLSMGFSRQEYWSGLPCFPPGDLPNPGIETTPPASPALAGRFFIHWAVSSVQLLSCVWLFATPWIAACQASLSTTNSRSSLRLSPSSQWCHPAISCSVVPSPPAPNPSQHQSLYQWVNSSHEVAKVLEFQL